MARGLLEFEGHGRRRVVADFDGGPITSDAGALLLRRVEQHLSFFDQVADCFTDHRNPDRIQHSLRTLIAQRIVAIALGYEDLNDHDQLRHDPLMALFSEKGHSSDSPPRQARSTLNRLEHAPSQGPDRYHKIDHDPEALQALLVELFLQAHPQPPDSITLDLDATDDPLTGTSRTGSSMDTTGATAIYRSTSSRTAICSPPCCDRPTSMPPPVPLSRSSASSPACAVCGLRSRSCCGPTPALPERR